MNKEPDEDIHRERSGGVLSSGASVSVELEGHPPGIRMCSPTWKLSEPRALGILMEASPHRHDRSLTPFSALLPSRESGQPGLKIPSF